MVFRVLSACTQVLSACARLSVSVDEQKKRASSEIANERKVAGREKRRVCKHFSQIHVPQSAQYSAHEKLILVSKCQMSKGQKGAV